MRSRSASVVTTPTVPSTESTALRTAASRASAGNSSGAKPVVRTASGSTAFGAALWA